jgi:hypothetical protein
VSPSDVQASEFALGDTSVRVIRVGNIIQVVFSKKMEAEYYYADAAAGFKSDEEAMRRKLGRD